MDCSGSTNRLFGNQVVILSHFLQSNSVTHIVIPPRSVFFVASVPGGHREQPNGHQWGHPKIGRILSKHCPPIDENSPIVAQCSSIGSLGPNVQSWIGNDIVNSFRKDQSPAGLRKIPQFKLIYPSFSNVKNSHDDLLGGGCLPYRKAVSEGTIMCRQ